MGLTGCALTAYLAKYKANKPGLAAVNEIADKYMGEFDAQEEEVRLVAGCAIAKGP